MNKDNINNILLLSINIVQIIYYSNLCLYVCQYLYVLPSISFLISNLQNLSSISDRLCLVGMLGGGKSSCLTSPTARPSSPSVIWDDGVSRPNNYMQFAKIGKILFAVKY